MAKTKKTTVKEGLAEDTAKVKALKRKTRKVLKDPSKAGEVADELAKGSIDAPEAAKDEDAEAVKNDDVTGGEGEPGTADTAGDAADGLEGGNSEEHPDLCTFLERAIANSRDAITKYTENLEELKAKVKEMGLEVPGLLDPEDVSDEETPEEFPPDIAPEGDAGSEGEGGEEAAAPAEGGEEGGEGVADGGDDVAVGDQEAGAGEGQEAGDSNPIPTKEVESSIAAPAPTSGTKLK